mgnify:CR=1 FL=1
MIYQNYLQGQIKEMSSRNVCIRSEECNVLAGLYKTINDEKLKLLRRIADKYKIPYDELYLRYTPQSSKLEDTPSAF